MDHFIEKHFGELLILILAALVLATLLILVPQLLRAHHRSRELQHTENMKALEKGLPLSPPDERSRLAGRTASLVPIVVFCAAGTVTCFLVSFKSEHEFTVALAVWCVAGVVGLASVTGGVTLIWRLAQLSAGTEEKDEEAETPESPLSSP